MMLKINMDKMLVHQQVMAIISLSTGTYFIECN